jgi:hypothetical protein
MNLSLHRDVAQADSVGRKEKAVKSLRGGRIIKPLRKKPVPTINIMDYPEPVISIMAHTWEALVQL